MGLRRQDLQEAFFVPGSHAFRISGCGTADPLEAAMAPGYFDAGRTRLSAGELILVSGGTALVMVSRSQCGVPVTARLAQDFGGPDGGAPNQPGPSAASTAPPGSVAAPPPAAEAAHPAAAAASRPDAVGRDRGRRR